MNKLLLSFAAWIRAVGVWGGLVGAWDRCDRDRWLPSAIALPYWYQLWIDHRCEIRSF
ncbi:MAG: hypothetical protein AB4040_10425 [Synechococcus sp.]